MNSLLRHTTLMLFLLMASICRPQGVPQESPQGNMSKDSVSLKINVLMIGIGTSQQLDTYLSPEHYTGSELRLMSHTTRLPDRHPQWAHQLVHQAYLSSTHQRADNANYLSGLYRFTYALQRRFSLFSNHFLMQVGGEAEGHLGFVYNTRNSNNPAQARAGISLGPTAVGIVPLGSIAIRGTKRLKASLRYELSVPIVGVRFSPNYGQSYYEIFSRGNYDHNLVITTPWNAPCLRQQLSADLTYNQLTLRIGYLNDLDQLKANGLKQHNYSNLFTIGIVKRFRTVKE